MSLCTMLSRSNFAELSCFRGKFYSCLTRRADASFELADAVVGADGPVRSLMQCGSVGADALRSSAVGHA